MVTASLRILGILVWLSSECLAQLKKEDLRLSKQKLFEKFQAKMEKSSLWKSWTANEKRFRFQVFLKNLKVINKSVPPPLGKDGRPLLGMVAASFRKGINKFAFLSDREFRDRFLISKSVLYANTFSQSLRDSPDNFFDSFHSPGATPSSSAEASPGFLENLDEELDSFDDRTSELDSLFGDMDRFLSSSERALEDQKLIFRRDRNLQQKASPSERKLQQSRLPGIRNRISWEHLFNPIFDQKDCNSCYAAASLSAIEAIFKKETGNQKSLYLSVQEIMDCSLEDSDCRGGQPSSVMQYVKDYGVAFSREYPYLGRKTRCSAKYFLNRIKKRSGPRFSSGRMLQYTRLMSDPRFNNYRRPFVNTYQSPQSPQAPYNSALQGYQSNLNQYGQLQYQRNQYSPNSQANSFQNMYSNNYAGYQMRNIPQQLWNVQQTPVTFQAPAYPSATKQLRLDGPKNTYYYEVVSFPNGVRKVFYRDTNNRPYTPSFLEKKVPVEDPPKSVKKTETPEKEDFSSDSEELHPLDSDPGDASFKESVKQSTRLADSRFEKLKGFAFIKQNVIDVLKALQFGPVVTAHFVSESFKFYESGVFDGDGCDHNSLEYVNHAAVIVGYDLDADVPYFKLRNSWADDWGEKGYYRMKIGELSKRNTGICLIAGTPFMVFPFLSK